MLRRLLGISQYGFPKPLLKPGTPMERLRTQAFSERLRQKTPVARLTLGLWCWLSYPPVTLKTSWLALAGIRRRRPDVRWTEFCRIYALAILRNVPPTEYDVYELDRSENRTLASHYLYWIDTPALLWMNRSRGADGADVQDKARFAHICAGHGLPHASVRAQFRGGKQVDGPGLHEILAIGDLWVKPTCLSNSQGAEAWTVDGNTLRSHNGQTLTPEQWYDTLCRTDCIVQRRLTNHADLRRASNGALISIRINTVLSHRNGAEWIGAGAAFPFGPLVTSSGGIGSKLDRDGVVTWVHHPAADLSAGHPDTGAPLIGLKIPQWEDALQLVLRAHREAFPLFASLGWDVVLTPEGPILLETNSGWGALGQQKLYGPLGQSAFRHVLEETLAGAAA